MYTREEIMNNYSRQEIELTTHGFTTDPVLSANFQNKMLDNRTTGCCNFMVNKEADMAKLVCVSFFEFMYMNKIEVVNAVVSNTLYTPSGTALTTPTELNYWSFDDGKTFYSRWQDYVDAVKERMLKNNYRKRGFKNA